MKTYISRLVSLPGRTETSDLLNIADTAGPQLFSFLILPLCLFQSPSFFHSVSSFLSNPLCKYIFYSASSSFYCHISFPALYSCMLKFTAVPRFGRWGMIPRGRHVFVASLKLSPDFLFSRWKKKINSTSLCSKSSILQEEAMQTELEFWGEKWGFICIHLHLINTSNLLTWKALIRNTTKLLHVYFFTPFPSSLSSHYRLSLLSSVSPLSITVQYITCVCLCVFVHHYKG